MNNYTPISWRWSKPTCKRSAFFPLAFEGEFDRFVKDLFNSGKINGETGTQSYVPAMTVHETKDEYLVTAEVPGVTEKEIEISLAEGVLTVSGEKKEELDRTEGKTHYVGRRYGSFSQQVFLESTVDEDKIDATVKDGVLKIKLPKSSAPLEKVRKVSVRAEK